LSYVDICKPPFTSSYSEVLSAWQTHEKKRPPGKEVMHTSDLWGRSFHSERTKTTKVRCSDTEVRDRGTRRSNQLAEQRVKSKSNQSSLIWWKK